MPSYNAQAALLVVDMQNDFADPSGSLYVEGGEELLPHIDQQIADAIAAGSPVFYTQDWHPPRTPHFARDGGIWPVHCVAGTWGAEFHPDLVIDGDVIRKGDDGRDGYSGFSVRDPESGEREATVLEELLRGRGIARVVVCGLATDYCVVETACDARMLGFTVEVLANAIRAVDLNEGDGDRAIARMRDAGAEFVA